MNKMKICFVTTTSITIRSFLIGQADYLSKHGYDVTVVCNDDSLLKEELPEEVHYTPIKMKRGLDGIGALKTIYLLYQLFKKERFDIVQYSTPNAALYAATASRLARIRVRLYCQWGIRYVGFTGWKRKLFKLLEKTICSLSTTIEPDSRGNLLFSRAEGLYCDKKSRVVWNGSANGVDLEKFDITKKHDWRAEIRKKHKIAESDFVLGFIGRLNKDKGINELLSAFKRISMKYRNTKLLMVGSKDRNSSLDEELLFWSENNESIIYSGFTTEVEKYIATMNIFILPSYREGFGSVVIEAEAMGIPVIVSDIPGPIDAIQEGETGLVVPKATVDPLVQAIETLMTNNEMYSRLSKNASEFVQQNFEQRKLWKYILEDKNALCKEHVSPKEGLNG